MSYRRLRVLLERLPLESATRTALRDVAPTPDPEDDAERVSRESRFGPWGLVNYQLADLLDAVRATGYYSAAAVTKHPPRPPAPTPRPGARHPLRRLSRAMAERIARLHPGTDEEG